MGEFIMKNELTNIYSTFPSEKHKTTQLINSSERVTWVPVLSCGESYRNMGISEKGSWVVEIASGLCELTDSQSYLYVMVLLEKNMEEIEKMLNESFHSSDISVSSIFLFGEIIKIGFQQRDEYWVDLAFNWYVCFPKFQKESFKNSLEDLAKSKRASQKLRQKAFKELKQLG